MRGHLDLAKFFYEKVMLVVLISVVSGAILYQYNIHSKAFEIAQVHSRGYSTLALQLRDLALSKTIKSAQDIRAAYNKSESRDARLPKEVVDFTDDLSVELSRFSRLLITQMQKTAVTAEQIGSLLRKSNVGFASGLAFNKSDIDKFDSEISRLQLQFIEAFNNEIGDLAINEFKGFYSRFEQEIPVWLRPNFLIWPAIILLIASTLGLAWFWLKAGGKDPVE